MLQITKGLTLQEAQIPFAWVEVRYPDKDRWDEAGFYAMVDEHLAALCGRYRDYVRADVFGQNPYFRFFRKFKKTFPVMMQFESVLLKGREFPKSNAVTAVPFLAELETHVLTGTHDVEQLLGPAELYLAQAKEPFVGLARAIWSIRTPAISAPATRAGISLQHDRRRRRADLRAADQPPCVLSGLRRAGAGPRRAPPNTGAAGRIREDPRTRRGGLVPDDLTEKQLQASASVRAPVFFIRL